MNSHHPLTLFVVKKSYAYTGNASVSTGLRTSAIFVVEMLLREGYRAKLVEAIDGNCIDRIVTEEKPARVVLEAIWVTPAKMMELIRLHPGIKWTVRVHSEIPFLAMEGCAIAWLAEFIAMGVEVAFNSDQTVDDFSILGKATYLPNYYPLRKWRKCRPESESIRIGCFGAVRPLKNQLIQAFAAIRYAQRVGKKLTFHMNGARIEQNGNNNLKNIEALFSCTDHELVMHPWLPHEEFLELVASMDICLQVSLSESFNITASDAVSMGVPLIGSDAIRWLPKRSRASVHSAESIYQAMLKADHTAVEMNHASLEMYLDETVRLWNAWIR